MGETTDGGPRLEIVIRRACDSPNRWMWTINSVNVISSEIAEGMTRSLSVGGTKASAVRFLRLAGITLPVRIER